MLNTIKYCPIMSNNKYFWGIFVHFGHAVCTIQHEQIKNQIIICFKSNFLMSTKLFIHFDSSVFNIIPLFMANLVKLSS